MSDPRVAIIAGASRRIGLGCAQELAARGYQVSLLARSVAVLERAQELGGIATQGSLTDPKDLHRWVNRTLDRWGRIDVAVCSDPDDRGGSLLCGGFHGGVRGWSVPENLTWGCPATYRELAQVVAFLVSSEAKFILGTTLKVDEAYSAAI